MSALTMPHNPPHRKTGCMTGVAPCSNFVRLEMVRFARGRAGCSAQIYTCLTAFIHRSETLL